MAAKEDKLKNESPGSGRAFALVLLGPEDEYLGIFGVYESKEAMEEDAETLHALILANIEQKLPLRDRLKLAPFYFPFAGRVQGTKSESIGLHGDEGLDKDGHDGHDGLLRRQPSIGGRQDDQGEKGASK